MNKLLTVVAILVIAPSGLFGQGSEGSIKGKVTGPQGAPVSYLWVRALDADGVEARRDEVDVNGAYDLDGLPAGDYKLEIMPPCCAFQNYESEPIAVGEGAEVEFAVNLREGFSFNTVGDDPGIIAAAIRSQAVIPDEPPPRTPGDKPDLSGIWLVGFDPFPDPVDAQDWAQELFDARIATDVADHPHTRCLPGDAPIAGGAAPFISKFVQTPDLLVILMEDYPGFRQVFMDGRKHPEFPNPSWMGHSIGHWEGDTLVIDTIGFNDRGWMGVYPRSEKLRIVERYTRDEYGYMDLEMTVEDPGVLNAPYVRRMPFHLAPHAELIEYVCENNKWAGPPAD